MSKKNKDGNVTGHKIEPNTEGWDAFVKEVNGLTENEISIPGEKTALSVFGGNQISADLLIALAFLNVNTQFQNIQSGSLELAGRCGRAIAA